MMARNPHGQKLPAAFARAGEKLTSSGCGDARPTAQGQWGQWGQEAQPPAQPRAPGSSLALQHRQENQPGSPSHASPSFSKRASLPGQRIHPRLAAGKEKFSGMVGPVPHGW